MNERYTPEDVLERRQMLNQSLRQARAQWFQTNIARRAKERTLEKLKRGQTKASKVITTAAEQLRTQCENQLGQLLSDLESREDEIEIYLEELAALPSDEEGGPPLTSIADAITIAQGNIVAASMPIPDPAE